MIACPKPRRIRSRALTDSARGRACTLRGPMCGSEGADAVFCHVRINAGIGTKPPDFFGFFGCAWCHREQEARRIPWSDVLRAVCETQTQMAVEGLLEIKGWRP